MDQARAVEALLVSEGCSKCFLCLVFMTNRKKKYNDVEVA